MLVWYNILYLEGNTNMLYSLPAAAIVAERCGRGMPHGGPCRSQDMCPDFVRLAFRAAQADTSLSLSLSPRGACDKPRVDTRSVAQRRPRRPFSASHDSHAQRRVRSGGRPCLTPLRRTRSHRDDVYHRHPSRYHYHYPSPIIRHAQRPGHPRAGGCGGRHRRHVRDIVSTQQPDARRRARRSRRAAAL